MLPTLHGAARSGNSPEIDRLLCSGAKLDTQNTEGDTALIIAVKYGYVHVVRQLLQAQANINRQNHIGNTALIVAAINGNCPIIEMLLQAGAIVDRANKDGYTALILAALDGNSTVVQQLLQAGAQVDRTNAMGNTALILAARNGRSVVVQQLLQSGTNIDYGGERRATALVVAALWGHAAIVQLLLQAGASIDRADDQGDTAFIVAARQGHSAVVQQLLQAGSQIGHSGERRANRGMGWIAAAFKGQSAVFHNLRQTGTFLERVNRMGNTALIEASTYGHSAVVQQLLHAGALVDHANRKGNTALIEAASNSHVDVLQKLLQAGAQVNHTNKVKDTALISAAQKGQLIVVHQLLQAGALIDHAGEDRNTALIAAARDGNSAVLQHLLQAGAKVHHDNIHGNNALIFAAQNGFPAIVHQLLQAGTQIDHSNYFGDTALLRAAFNGQSDVVQQLLHWGAQINHANKQGDTALIFAAQGGYSALVQQLLLAGAQKVHANNHGDTALILAKRNNHFSVVQQLLQADFHFNHPQQYGDTMPNFGGLNRTSAGVDEASKSKASASPSSATESTTPLHTAQGSKHNAGNQSTADAHPQSESTKSPNPPSELPKDSETASQTHPVEPQAQLSNPLEKLWIKYTSSAPQKNELLAALKSEHITTFSSFIIAHNLLLLAFRQRVLRKDEVRHFGKSRDYIFEQVYLPVTTLSLTQEHKYLVEKALSYAEKIGLIRDGHTTLLKIVADLRSEIRESRIQLQTALVDIARKINRLGERVDALDNWTKRATEEVHRVCKGQKQMVADMKKMGTCLNELHSLLRKHQRNRKIAGVLALCLSMIPVVGGMIAGAAVASNDLAFGISAEHATALGTSGIAALFAVDLSSFQSIGTLTSTEFLSKLEPVAQKRVETVVKHSNFQTVARLQNEVHGMMKDLEMSDMDLDATADEETELRQRFNFLASSSNSETVSAQEAVGELQHILEKRLNLNTEADDVTEAVIEQMGSSGRLTFDEFYMAYSDIKQKYPAPQVRKIPVELSELFKSSVGGFSQLRKSIAKCVLRSLFKKSDSGRSGIETGVSFRRSRDEWNDEEVDRLFAEHGANETMIEEEGFIKVGMKVLFGE